MTTKHKTVLALVGFGIIDAVIPVPILCIVMIYVVMNRPPWFTDLYRDIYQDDGPLWG